MARITLPNEVRQQLATNLSRRCFSDIQAETNCSPSTVARWRTDPPRYPTTQVFCLMAYAANLEYTTTELAYHYNPLLKESVPLNSWKLQEKCDACPTSL